MTYDYRKQHDAGSFIDGSLHITTINEHDAGSRVINTVVYCIWTLMTRKLPATHDAGSRVINTGSHTVNYRLQTARRR